MPELGVSVLRLRSTALASKSAEYALGTLPVSWLPEKSSSVIFF